MSATTKRSPQTKRVWGQDFCAKRTEAMPKNSLFGCELEIGDNTSPASMELEEFVEKEKQDRIAKSRRYKTELPDYMKKRISVEPLAQTRQKLKKQLKDTDKARYMLDLLEEKSKYFTVGTISGPQRLSNSCEQGNHSIPNSDDAGSGQQDRYTHLPPVHNYSLIGDPLRLGMEFLEKECDATAKVQVKKRKPFIPPQQLSKEHFMQQYASRKPNGDTSSWAVQLPANIQHQFGTKVCSAVLTDKEKVDETIMGQKRLRESFLKIKPKKSSSNPSSTVEIDPLYDSLGQALRQDIFPGHTFGHKKSFQSSVYTDDVFKQRVADPDEFRYQRDELSRWAEQNVLRDRVKKAWDVYLAETLQKKAKPL